MEDGAGRSGAGDGASIGAVGPSVLPSEVWAEVQAEVARRVRRHGVALLQDRVKTALTANVRRLAQQGLVDAHTKLRRELKAEVAQLETELLATTSLMSSVAVPEPLRSRAERIRRGLGFADAVLGEYTAARWDRVRRLPPLPQDAAELEAAAAVPLELVSLAGERWDVLDWADPVLVHPDADDFVTLAKRQHPDLAAAGRFKVVLVDDDADVPVPVPTLDGQTLGELLRGEVAPCVLIVWPEQESDSNDNSDAP